MIFYACRLVRRRDIFLGSPAIGRALSLSEIKFEHTYGVIRRELVSGECARLSTVGARMHRFAGANNPSVKLARKAANGFGFFLIKLGSDDRPAFLSWRGVSDT
jgi:hypothetical protein